MKESVIYQEILLEGEARGEARGESRGIAKGKAETANQIAQNMLLSNISIELVAKFTGLPLKQVQRLQKLATKQSKPPKSTRLKRSPN
jgi:predicted transposase/invertase (TIGR01784 family)